VSQSARQGTVAPTHYHVVRNSGNPVPVDRIQRLSYKLTHLYYNWNGTIRVPAPCQYAHKLAFITGESLHETAHNSLAKKLWFL
jgi:aubergine-like protein